MGPTPNDTAAPCLACGGAGGTVGYACPGFRRVEMPCAPCGGSGRAPPWQAEAVERGKVLRADRLARRVTLREEARQLGISVVALSQAELGHAPVSSWPQALAVRLL